MLCVLSWSRPEVLVPPPPGKRSPKKKQDDEEMEEDWEMLDVGDGTNPKGKDAKEDAAMQVDTDDATRVPTESLASETPSMEGLDAVASLAFLQGPVFETASPTCGRSDFGAFV
jgi:hypothetical protein